MLTGEQSRDTCAPNAVLSIDIANVEEMIAVEVDGPFHFVTRVDLRSQKERGEGVGKMKKRKLEHEFSWNGDYQEINGSTASNQRLLTALGWRVIRVPFWEWYAQKNDPVAQEKYCQELLKRARGVEG